MEIEVVAGSIQGTDDELIVVNLFEGVKKPGGATAAVDQALGGAIGDAITAGDLRGKKGEIALFYSRGRPAGPAGAGSGAGATGQVHPADRARGVCGGGEKGP